MNEQSAGLHDMTARIVIAYVSCNALPSDQVPALVAAVHAALSRLGSSAEPAARRPQPPVPVRKTIGPDALISLEDGKSYKTLTRHLRSRGLTPDQYREKWRLPADYPMIAANYAAKRSAMAKAIGLGVHLRKPTAGGAEIDIGAAEPTTRRRNRKAND